MKRILTVLLAIVAALCLCFGLAACKDVPAGGTQTEQGSSDASEDNDDGSEADGETHTHIAEHFQVDGNEHWKVCTVCSEKFSVGAHSYNSDNACTTCGYSTVYTKGLAYELDEDTDTYTVTGIGEATDTADLIIPAYYEGKAVTSIGDYAFENCDGLTSIIIPDSVTQIGWSAFSGTAYYDDDAKWDSDGALYIGNHLIAAKNTITGVYTVKPGTKTIAGSAFYGCSGLTSIVIPDSVTSIGNSAFEGCGGLTSIVIPDSVTSIGNSAFHSCRGLTSIVIPDSVTSIGGWAFEWCSNLEHITVADGNAVYKSAGDCLIEIATDTLILGCKNSVIPGGVTKIGNAAFYVCDGLTSVTISKDVTSIGERAFYYCQNLTDIQFQGTVAEWRAIEKGNYWNNYADNYIVTCTDGTINRSGNVTYFEE